MISKSFFSLRKNLQRISKISTQLTSEQHRRSFIKFPFSDRHTLNFHQKYGFSGLFDQLKMNEARQNQFPKQNQVSAQSPSKPKPQSKKIKRPQLSPQLKNIAKQLQQQQSYFIPPLYHTKTYHYASFLLTAVRLLHQRKAFSDENLLKTYFREVKNSIKTSQEKVFTPKSALNLMQEFSLIEFDGDQSLAIDKILNYAEEGILQFQESQLEQFKTAYKNIMVNKAFGPVQFRPLNMQKSYTSENERKAEVIKQKLTEKLRVSKDQLDKQFSLDYKSSKKWFNVKLPSRNLYILTYSKNYQSFTEDEVYQYLYDMKQLILTLMSKSRKTKIPHPISIEIRHFSQQDSNDTQTLIDEGIVYKQKKIVVDEMQKIRQMRKLSLKQQIQRINEKKKALKEKQKQKGKQKSISLQHKQAIGQTKTLDFIETIKHSMNEFNDELIEKFNKRNLQKRKLTRKERRQMDRIINRVQGNEQKENQIEQDDEYQDENDQDMQKAQSSVYSNEPLKIKSQLVQKMQQDMKAYKQRMALIKQKQLENKQSSEAALLTSLININHEQFQIKDYLSRIEDNHSLQQLKEFSAYIDLISSLNKVIAEIHKDQIKQKRRNVKKSSQDKKYNNDSNSEQKQNFELIKNQLNEPLDTNVYVNAKFSQIFGKFDNIPKPSKEKTKNSSENELDSNAAHTIFILPQSELFDSFYEGRQQKKLEKRKKNVVIQQESVTQLEEKQQILQNIFKIPKMQDYM